MKLIDTRMHAERSKAANYLGLGSLAAHLGWQFDLYAWDIIRGQRLSDIPIMPTKVSGEGIIVFARYASPGPHRASIGIDREVRIDLEKHDFKITPVTPQ